MRIKALPPEILQRELESEEDEVITIVNQAEIVHMLSQGFDSYDICRKLNVSALQVINADRLHRGLQRTIKQNPTPIIDNQETDPKRRLLLFPPVDDNE